MSFERKRIVDKLYIVIPAYNEEENIEKVVEEWYKIVELYNTSGGSRLVIVDDGSRDCTYEILKKLSESRPLLIPISKENEGHGATVLYAYNYAIEQGADYVFQTDSDGQTLPDEFHDFWDSREKYSMIIGHRNHRQDGLSRVIVTKTLKLVIKLCFHVTVKDANTPFRLMRVCDLKENLKYVPEKFNLANVILSVIYEKKKMPVRYMEITFRPRQGGKNSINIRKIVKIGKRAIKDFATIQNSINSFDGEQK